MDAAAHSSLAAWESFYIIVGSSAGALTGLQFVVAALIADSDTQQSGPQEIAAFGTPTILHFCAALLVSALLSAPWPALHGAGVVLGIVGTLGVLYTGVVVRRARRQQGYQPVLEDWVWHAILPFVAYAAYLLAGLQLTRDPDASLWIIAAASLLLVFVGIHNAWDSVAYIAVAFDRKGRDAGKPKRRSR